MWIFSVILFDLNLFSSPILTLFFREAAREEMQIENNDNNNIENNNNNVTDSIIRLPARLADYVKVSDESKKVSQNNIYYY